MQTYWAASKGRCSKTDRLSSSGIQTVLILGGLIMNMQSKEAAKQMYDTGLCLEEYFGELGSGNSPDIG